MKILLLSDIHGNLGALNAVLNAVNCGSAPADSVDGIMLLGDNIDYGPRSNEVIARLASLDIPILASIWGNHEKAIFASDFDRFSTKRGRESAQNTSERLNKSSRSWLMKTADHSGMLTYDVAGKRILLVHGDITDPFWGTISPTKEGFSGYADYEYVLSGHSHLPHIFTVLVKDDNPTMRNKKAITFVNPGSVGQPRDHNPFASYIVWDTEQGFLLNRVTYDIEFEQSFYDGSVDQFYCDRLMLGI